MVRFSWISLATLLVLSVATVVVSRQIAKHEAVRDARTRSESVARSIAAPIVNAAVRERDPAAMLVLKRAMDARIKYGSVTHIVLWDTKGNILWAEDPSVVGMHVPLSEELNDLVADGGTIELTPQDRPRHPGRSDEDGELLEIYVAATDADGVPFLFETYISPGKVDQDYRAILGQLLPVSLGVILLLLLSTVPSALSLARRVDRLNAQRSNILRRSLQSWHEERRRLAQDLHDGVIQDLSAMSYALPALIDRLPDDPAAAEARKHGVAMNGLLQRDLTILRTMVLDLAPAELDGPGLVVALESLGRQADDLGLDVSLGMDHDLELGETTGGLIYRVVREGLRNVAKHAGATAVVVEVRRLDDRVEVRVDDDGRGLSSTTAPEGHDGLRLLGQLVQELGGTLSLDGRPHGGASLRVVVPRRLPDLDGEHL